ncbi:MAG: hypothetical protein CTY16_07035 [Methylobacter sp.]|nr:MAG: hypothetical protein CTY16_07035 [Methylobacter sp.]
MKKLLLIVLAATALWFSAAYASGGYGYGGEWGEHHGHHHGHHWRPQYREVIQYYPPPRPYYREVIQYYPPRPRPYYREETRYYQEPRPQPYPYYQQHYQPNDPRSVSGLAGGVIGGAMGYQFGGGDPLAAGIGAAAGAYLGNGMDGR